MSEALPSPAAPPGNAPGTDPGTSRWYRHWQPLTPAGVAAYARAPFYRWFGLGLFTALLTAGMVLWFCLTAFFPVIAQAIVALPDEGIIADGRLPATIDSSRVLAENRFLAMVVVLDGRARAGAVSDFRIEFQERQWAICSLFGCLFQPYQPGFEMEANRRDLAPRWEAWKPMLLGCLAFAVISGLELSWVALATLYFPAVWLIAWLSDRDLNAGGAWRLSWAALMPGAWFCCAGIAAYGLGMLDLLRFLLVWLLHWIVSWIYLGTAIACLPTRVPRPHPGANPFASSGD